MLTVTDLAGWRAAASCLNADPDLFFPISSTGRSLSQIRQAKAICAGCQVIKECLAFAQANEPISGIWGGTTAAERASTRRREQRARRALARASFA